MATVYLAHDLRHDRSVALKVLHPDLAATLGPERFQREIRLAARLQHPNILSVFDSGAAAGHLWFTMPYVEGESLRDRLRRETQLPLDDAVRIATDAARALEYAHQHGIVHRDIKPENLLLTRDGSTLVADFGIARALGEEGEQLTRTGMSVGTPVYMSPEQGAADRHLDARTDVYSLGCVLYEMLAGEPPITGPTAQAIIAKRLGGDVPSVRRVRPTVPEAVAAAIARALAPVPADRWQTAADFARALAPLASTGEAAAPATTRVVRPPKAWRLPSWLAFSLGLAVMASTAMLLWRQRADRPPSAAPEASSGAASDQKSIAVLPLQNIGGDSTNQYFSDGISQEILGALGGVPGLLVAGRTSSFRYREADIDPREVGRQLGVGSLLSGALQRRGDAVRVSVEVVDTRTGYQLWSAKYDRRAADLFALEDEIAKAVAQALAVKLMGGGAAAPARRDPVNAEAHDLSLRAGALALRADSASVYQALALYGRALALDSSYAVAWAGLSTVYGLIADVYEAPMAVVPKAKAAALRAVALDSSLASAHLVLALISETWEWNYALAAAEYRKALTLDPNAPDTHLWYGMFLSVVAMDFGGAERELKRAAALDPFNPQIVFYQASLAADRGDFDGALARVQRLKELVGGPSYYGSNMGAYAYAAMGKWQECVAATQGPGGERELCEVHLGRPEPARRLAREMEQQARTAYVDKAFIAFLYAALGNPDRALDWLERAAADRSANVPGIRFDFRVTPEVRGSPRYAALLRTMGLPPKGPPPGLEHP